MDWHELLCFGSSTVYNLRPSTCSSVSCGRILQRAYCADQGISRAVRSLWTKSLPKRWADLSCLESNKCFQIKDVLFGRQQTGGCIIRSIHYLDVFDWRVAKNHGRGFRAEKWVTSANYHDFCLVSLLLNGFIFNAYIIATLKTWPSSSNIWSRFIYPLSCDWISRVGFKSDGEVLSYNQQSVFNQYWGPMRHLGARGQVKVKVKFNQY